MIKRFLRCPLAAARHPFGAVLVVAVVLTACAPKGEALYNRANEAMAKGDTRAAVIDLKNLVESEPQNAKARALLALALVRGGELGAGAIELQKARELGAPADLIIVPQCRVLLSKGEFAKVLEQCKPQSAPEGDKVEMLIAQGGALLGLERTEEAKAQFEAALAAQPDNLDARMGLAGATFKLDGSAAARAVLDGAPEVTRQRPTYWMAVGGTCMEGGDLVCAEKSFAKAVDVADKSPENSERLIAMGALAEAQIRAGKVKEATASQ